MIRSFTVCTKEIDDVEVAVADILGQIDAAGKNRLLTHTVGIVSCYAGFVESGVWEALCEKLPFEVIGATTIANLAGEELSETLLCLLILTSDEAVFTTGVSAPLTGEEEAPLQALYDMTLKKLPGKPALMLSYVPLMHNLGSEFYTETMAQISDGVPNFGTLAVDHNPDYHESQVLLNGKSWTDCAAILLIYGSISPAFYVGTISDQKLFTEKNVVTASDGNQLQTVNGMPAIAFLQSIGLTKNEDGSIDGINSFPLVMDYNDGSAPVIRAMFALTPEGYAVCGGRMSVGATLSIGSFDGEEIVATTRSTLNQAMEAGSYRTFLMYSCIGRYFALGYDTEAELQALRESFGQSEAAYMTAYSGGEICPVSDGDGGYVNRAHNSTFILCAF